MLNSGAIALMRREKPLRVIVNADDFGISETANQSIIEAIECRRVTSASILANGPAFESAVRAAKRYPGVSFGIHLNVSEFQPIKKQTALTTILTPDGAFAGNTLRNCNISFDLQKAIYQEWSAQVMRAQKCGIKISHIDSHHHMHTVPSMFPVVKAVQRRFGIRKIRISMNLYSTSDSPRTKFILVKKKLWNAAVRNVWKSRTTDGFTALSAFCETPVGSLRSFDSIELMVHPGSNCGNDESELLISWRERCELPLQLISYEDL